MTERLWTCLSNGFLGFCVSLLLLCAVISYSKVVNLGIMGWLIGICALFLAMFYAVGVVSVFIEAGKQPPEDDSVKTKQESLRESVPVPPISWLKNPIQISQR